MRCGAPDVVIYNASGTRSRPFVDLVPAEVERTLTVSAFGGFLVAQQAVRRMLPKGYGAVLFTGASASIKGYAAVGAVRDGQVRAARPRPEHGARARAARHPRRAFRHRRRDPQSRADRAGRTSPIRCSIPMPSRPTICTSSGSRAAPGPGRSSSGPGSRGSEPRTADFAAHRSHLRQKPQNRSIRWGFRAPRYALVLARQCRSSRGNDEDSAAHESDWRARPLPSRGYRGDAGTGGRLPEGGKLRGVAGRGEDGGGRPGGLAATINSALAGVRFDPAIVKKDRAQGVFAQDFLEFSDRMVAGYRLTQGKAKIAKNKNTLRADREAVRRAGAGARRVLGARDRFRRQYRRRADADLARHARL